MTDSDTINLSENPTADAIEAAEELRKAAGLKAGELKEAATGKACDLKEAATERGQQIRDVAFGKAESLKDFAEENLGVSADKISEWKDETEKFVKENPGKSVAIALGLGFVLANLMKKD